MGACSSYKLYKMPFGIPSSCSSPSSFSFGSSSPVNAVQASSLNFGGSPVNVSQAEGFNIGASSSFYSSPGTSLNFGASSPVNASPAAVFSFAVPRRSVTQPAKLQKREYPCVEKATQTEEFHVTKCVQVLAELLESGHYSDITLSVKNKVFSVHSKILSAHSPVFAAMMTHDSKEKASGVVNIDDCEPELFNDFLHFLYSGNLNLNPGNVADLYAIADKYQVNEFSKACVLYMKTHISLETFCDIMDLSLRYHERELIEVATNYFVQNSVAIAKTAKWLIFMKANLVAGNELFLKALELKKQ